jgi:hypothetical protein
MHLLVTLQQCYKMLSTTIKESLRNLYVEQETRVSTYKNSYIHYETGAVIYKKGWFY